MQVEEKVHFINGLGFWVKKISINPEPDKPTLVFLHDALGCTATWKNFPQSLCKETNLNGLVYDRQGHGNSDPSHKTRPLDYLEKEAFEVLPTILSYFRIEKKILVGHSDGASISLLYESEFQSCQAVVSLAGHIKVEPITLKNIEKAKKDFLQSHYFEKLKCHHGGKTQKVIDDWANSWLSDGFRFWNISQLMKGMKCPVLAIQGKDDEYATEEHLFELTTNIGNKATPVLLENCGHFPHKEKPADVIKIISQFLKPVTQNSKLFNSELIK